MAGKEKKRCGKYKTFNILRRKKKRLLDEIEAGVNEYKILTELKIYGSTIG